MSNGTRTIPLSQGRAAIVDEADYERVMHHKWYASYHRDGNLCYAARNVRKPRLGAVRLHRFILDAPPNKLVDHINGDPLDNRRCNLRLCSNAQNCWNSRKRAGTSRFKGVCWHKRYHKWQAKIRMDSRQIHLGVFDSEEQAHAAYCEASAKYHGEFGRTG